MYLGYLDPGVRVRFIYRELFIQLIPTYHLLACNEPVTYHLITKELQYEHCTSYRLPSPLLCR